MSKHHTEDYKLSAVLYYLSHDKNLRDTCEIFNCNFQSLARWIERYEKQGSVKRKDRDTKNLKITNEIEIFVKDHVKQFPTTILWELSKLVNDKFKVELSDSSIHNILSNHSITRKRVRSKYYPEKVVGQEQADIAEFYKKLNKFKYNKTICLDETSIYLNMVLPYGRSKSGTRVIKKTNKYPYKRYNC
jgi:transposase